MTLFSSSTVRPVAFESMRRSPSGGPNGDVRFWLLEDLLSMMTSLPGCVLTTMPPLKILTFNSPGREGSLKLTVNASCACAWRTAHIAITSSVFEMTFTKISIRLLGLQDPNVAVESIERQFRSAIADTGTRKIAFVNKPAVAPFRNAHRRRPRRYRKIRVDAAVECLVPDVGREVSLKSNLDGSIQ